MKKLLKIIKEKLKKKSFWLPNSIAEKIEVEAKKNWDSESALAKHIFTEWFKGRNYK